MNSKWHNKIDFLFSTNKTANTFGNCKNVTIRVVGRIDTKKMPKTQNDLRLALDASNLAAGNDLAIR